jgi:hypothetical protein
LVAATGSASANFGLGPVGDKLEKLPEYLLSVQRFLSATLASRVAWWV